MTSIVISKDGTPIAYEKLGSGTPLILVDGALCSRSFGPMPKFASLLSENFTVVMYDRRGRGESADSMPYSPEREVEDIEALVNEAGGSAYIFGISSGAALALRAAEKKIGITKLALYEPPFVYDKTNDPPPLNHESKLKELLAAGNRSGAVKYFMTGMVGMPSIASFVMQLMPMWKKLKAVAHTLPYDAAVMGDFSVPIARIASVTIPTFIAGGGKSSETLRHAVHLVADALPNGTLKIMESENHNVAASVLVPVLTDFFTQK
jgi:pimeloyl-ACP methyl ester carboxylesterase